MISTWLQMKKEGFSAESMVEDIDIIVREMAHMIRLFHEE